MVHSSGFRRFALRAAAAVFVLVAVQSTFWPEQLFLGGHLDTVDARNEFRAIYLGLWLATAVLLWIAARRVHEPLLGDLGGLLIFGQVFGRLVSLGMDGMPGSRIWAIGALELLGALAIAVVRPAEGTRQP